LALGKKIIIVKKTQQLILGTGTAIWWLTEPHCKLIVRGFLNTNQKMNNFVTIKKM
jgi:hypothetical protein